MPSFNLIGNQPALAVTRVVNESQKNTKKTSSIRTKSKIHSNGKLQKMDQHNFDNEFVSKDVFVAQRAFQLSRAGVDGGFSEASRGRLCTVEWRPEKGRGRR